MQALAAGAVNIVTKPKAGLRQFRGQLRRPDQRHQGRRPANVRRLGPALALSVPAALNTPKLARRDLAAGGSRGEADRHCSEGENQMRLTTGTYTTCEPGNNDWYAKASDLKLDYDRKWLTARTVLCTSSTCRFSIRRGCRSHTGQERKSGFLAPSWGTDSDNGTEFALPITGILRRIWMRRSRRV